MRGKKCIYEGIELTLTSSTVGIYTGSCGFPNTVMYESFTEYLTSILPNMVLAGDTDSKERSLSLAESVFKIFICFIFTIQVQYEWNLKRKQKKYTITEF